MIVGLVMIGNAKALGTPDASIDEMPLIVNSDQIIIVKEIEVVEKDVFVSELTPEMEAERDEFINNPEMTGLEEEFCLAQNIYFEASIDNLAGKAAVANTVLNRVAVDGYPDTVCGAIHQGERDANGNMIRNRCQFSWYCDGKSDVVPASENWEESKALAWDMLNTDQYRGLAEGATHYHATYVNPSWSRHTDMTEVGRIGAHVFYRWDA